ncbi:MAG: hypothetical protein LBQ54_14365 [Planctomycetaceae bacterium]|nr:hypothetical protein [Planctomycetaceae bacterium]
MALHNYLERRREEGQARKKAELAKQAESAKWTGIGKWAARQKRAGILAPTRQFLQTMEKRMPGLLARFEKGYNVEKAIQNPDSPLMRHVMSQNWPGQLTHQQLTDLGRARPIPGRSSSMKLRGQIQESGLRNGVPQSGSQYSTDRV